MSHSIQTDPFPTSLSENKLNTDELLTDFFMEVYNKEMSVMKISESHVLAAVSKMNNIIGFGPSPVNRCCYMISCATHHTLLVKECITRFLNEYSNAADLINGWRSNLNISSLSFGPAVECIAFNLAVLESSKHATAVSNVSVIPTYSKEWFQTVKIISDLFKKVETPLKLKYLEKSTVKNKMAATIKTIFKSPEKEELRFLRDSNVVLMFRPFNLFRVHNFKIHVNKVIESLKSGSLIFSIDSSKASLVMQSVMKENVGTFLYGPVSVPSRESSIEICGTSVASIPSSTYEFFVWVKDFDLLASEKFLKKSLQSLSEIAVHSVKHEDPKKLVISKDDLKEVEMFYSFHIDQGKDSKSLLRTRGTETNLVAGAVLENKLNTNRLVADFFMEVFKTEVAQFNVKESIDLLLNFPELSSLHADFDDDKSRCAYMYFYATCHTLLMKECFKRFLTDYPESKNLLKKWNSDSKHCSLSHGPGLDYIAFSLAVLEVSKTPIAITDARIITTQDKWKCTVKVLCEVLQRVRTPLNLIFAEKNTKYQDSRKLWESKAVKKMLSTSSVIFMFKTINLGETETPPELPPLRLMEIIRLMAPGSCIFFMDSASSASVMKMALGYFSGTSLYGPTSVSKKDLQIEVSEELKNNMQLLPCKEAEVEFFVWEKMSTTSKKNKKSSKVSLNIQSSNCAMEIEPNSEDVKESLESFGVPSDEENTLECPVSFISASTEHSSVSKLPNEIDLNKEKLSSNELEKIGSLMKMPSSPFETELNETKILSQTPVTSHPKSNQNSMTLKNSSKSTKFDVKQSSCSLNLTPNLTQATTEYQFKTIGFLTKLFMEVYEKEVSLYGGNIPFSMSTVHILSSTFRASHNSMHVRCAYMYHYAACHTQLIKDCITRFLTEYSYGKELVKYWKSSHSCFCSLSLGPGLDYIAVGLAVLELTQQPMVINDIHIITKCIGWKNTVDILSDVKQKGEALPFLNFDSSKVVIGSVFEPWESTAIDYLLAANMLFMFKTLDLSDEERSIHPFFLRELINIINAGTVIFFIDSSHSSRIMQEELTNHPGKFLYGPILVACKNIPIGQPEKVMDIVHIQSEAVDFFVWEKHSGSPKNHQGLEQLNKTVETKSSVTESCDNSSSKVVLKAKNHQGLEQLNKPLETKSNFTESCDNSSSRVVLKAKRRLPFAGEGKTIISPINSVIFSSNCPTDPATSVDAKQENVRVKSNCIAVKVDCEDKISNHHSPQKLINSSPLNPVSSELPKVPKSSMQVESTEGASSNYRVDKIKSLIERIKKVSSHIENNF